MDEQSAKTRLAAVYKKSPSVIVAPKIKKETIRSEDHQMEKAINEIFKDTDFRYNPGGMVYEAMANDGENIYLLKPRKDRKKYTKAELEEMLFQEVLCRIESFLYGVDISQNPAWSLAVENDIKLKDHKYYSDPKNMDLEALMEFIKVSEKKSSVFALSNLHKYGQEALKAHPEAVVALLETLARYPNTSLYEYKEVVKSTKKLLKKEFNTDEKLNELFLRSKKAKKL